MALNETLRLPPLAPFVGDTEMVNSLAMGGAEGAKVICIRHSVPEPPDALFIGR